MTCKPLTNRNALILIQLLLSFILLRPLLRILHKKYTPICFYVILCDISLVFVPVIRQMGCKCIFCTPESVGKVNVSVMLKGKWCLLRIKRRKRCTPWSREAKKIFQPSREAKQCPQHSKDAEWHPQHSREMDWCPWWWHLLLGRTTSQMTLAPPPPQSIC